MPFLKTALLAAAMLFASNTIAEPLRMLNTFNDKLLCTTTGAAMLNSHSEVLKHPSAESYIGKTMIGMKDYHNNPRLTEDLADMLFIVDAVSMIAFTAENGDEMLTWVKAMTSDEMGARFEGMCIDNPTVWKETVAEIIRVSKQFHQQMH